MPRRVDRLQEGLEILDTACRRESSARAPLRRLAVRREQAGGDQQAAEQVVMGAKPARPQFLRRQGVDRLAQIGIEACPLAQLQEVDQELAIDQPAALQLGIERSGGRVVSDCSQRPGA